MKSKHTTFWKLLFILGAILLATLPALAGEVAYTYDALNRLIRVVAVDGTVIEYTYDATGNRTSYIVKPGGSADLTDSGRASESRMDTGWPAGTKYSSTQIGEQNRTVLDFVHLFAWSCT